MILLILFLLAVTLTGILFHEEDEDYSKDYYQKKDNPVNKDSNLKD